MARPTRTSQSRSRSKTELGDSWVVESDGDDETDTPSNMRTSTSSASKTHSPKAEEKNQPVSSEPMRRRSSRVDNRPSAEPEFIMPSIHEESLVNVRSPVKRRTLKGERSSRPELRNSNFGDNPENLSTDDKPVSYSEIAGHSLLSILNFLLDITWKVLHILKIPMAYIIAFGIMLWLILGVLVLLKNLMTTSISSALSPICRIPGVSFLHLDMCKLPISMRSDGGNSSPAEFDQLMTVQSKFEEVLEASAGSASLPLDMKRGEISIRDLRQVVSYSRLDSKNELVLEFDGFIETARIASYDLQKFNSHVGRGVDNILSTARWTKRVLDDIAVRDGSRGAIGSFISDKFLAPFQPIKFTENVLLDQYIKHTQIVEEEIIRLIDEAQALLMVLQNLDDRLDVINGIAVRDGIQAKGSRDEILTHLFTFIGGNRKALGKYDAQLDLLQRVHQYRRLAVAHVSGTMLKLQAMGSELEELRERVGSAELLRDRTDIPLAVHIENVQLGVERLEAGRSHARVLENERLRQTMDGRRRSDEERLIES